MHQPRYPACPCCQMVIPLIHVGSEWSPLGPHKQTFGCILAPPGVATHLFAASFLALLEPLIVLPTFLILESDLLDSDRHFRQSHHLIEAPVSLFLQTFCRLSTLPAPITLAVPSSIELPLSSIINSKTPFRTLELQLRASVALLRDSKGDFHYGIPSLMPFRLELVVLAHRLKLPVLELPRHSSPAPASISSPLTWKEIRNATEPQLLGRCAPPLRNPDKFTHLLLTLLKSMFLPTLRTTVSSSTFASNGTLAQPR